ILKPAGHTLAPILPLEMGPVTKHLKVPALGQIGGHLPDNPADQGIAGQTAGAVDVVAFGGDHERRVGDHKVEPAAADAGEQITLSALEVVKAFEPRVESSKTQGTGVAINGNDVLAVLGGQQGQNTASGTQIE